jgi:fumarylacetoacetase
MAVTGTSSIPPGFEYFPVGYHGRSSSIVVSGTGIVRPEGQFRNGEGKVVFGKTRKLDYEMEIAAVVGKTNELGKAVEIVDADEHIFGLVLVNDWSGEFIFVGAILTSERKEKKESH